MMKKIVAFSLILLFSLCFPTVCCAERYAQAIVIDDADLFSERQENDLMTELTEAVAKTGLNLMVVTTNDIGRPKTDERVVEFSEDKYEEYCGINTDGVLLLINNDTLYDYISTSGSGINYLSDYRIECILDDVYYCNVDERYYDAAKVFILDILKYYSEGKANDQQEILGMEVEMSDFETGLTANLIFIMPAAIVISIIFFSINIAPYKLVKPNTRHYILKNSLLMRESSDTYVGVVTTTRYSPRSSGSSHHHHSSSGGSHSHHSSTHHSHSGGRHGGGGRHR